METTRELHVTNRKEWREWLRENHGTKKEVWLIYYKEHTGKPRIPYEDAVEEALCFGWIDSTVKKIDDEKFAQKFTPRKGNSRWSETNKKRAKRMIKEGKMTEAGLQKIAEAKKSGEWFKTARVRRMKLAFPPDLHIQLTANKKALDNFNRLADGYKRLFVAWVTNAKREETRQRRLTEAIKLLEQNKKLGMK